MSTIFVVGIGPGAYEKMTIEAADALRNCDVIIGYTVYVDLVKEHFAGKEFLTTPMRKEVERCRSWCTVDPRLRPDQPERSSDTVGEN